jgi:TonB family protein
MKFAGMLFLLSAFIHGNYIMTFPSQDSETPADISIKVNAAKQMTSIFKSTLSDAEKGFDSKQYFTGKFYGTGTGVERDYVQAYKWLYLCASGEGRIYLSVPGNEKIGSQAANLLDIYGGKMKPEQIAQARRLALDWKAAHPAMPRTAVGPGRGGSVTGAYPIHVVGGDIVAPALRIQPLPIYTAEAFDAGIQGTVLLQCMVRKDGTVDSFKVLQGLGYGLDESAIMAIAAQGRFQPGKLKGNPVDVQVNISVSFTLGQPPPAAQ